jgi:predicted amidohydrolase YtcJ
MVDSGIVTNLVSDFPGAFDRSHVATIDPLRNMYVAMTRAAPDGTAFHPEQSLRIDDALRAYTSWPAYSSREESLKGTISPGKVADLVVLSDDITRGDPDLLLRTMWPSPFWTATSCTSGRTDP